MSGVKDWWRNLQLRERSLLTAGAAALLLLIGYFQIWEPLKAQSGQLRVLVTEQQELLAWMQQAVRRVEALRGGGPAMSAGGGSVLTVATQTGRKALGDTVKRVEERRRGGVNVWFENAAFDDLVRWLGRLEQQHGIEVESISVDAQKQKGRVSGQLALRR